MKDDNQNVQNKTNLEIEELKRSVDEYKNKYLRALADYQNLERQTSVWKEEFTLYASAKVIGRLLEIADDLEKAQEILQDSGLKLIVEKLSKLLQSEGLETIDVEGKEYNPNLAEVVSVETGNKNNIVTKVLQKGYKIKDRIIRPAKVIVSKLEN